MNIKNVKMIWEIDFSKFVSEVFGRPYSLQQHGDCGEPMGQNTITTLEVSSDDIYEEDAEVLKNWLEADTNPDAEDYPGQWELRFRRGEIVPIPSLEMIGYELNRRGLLDEGEYVIHIWW